MEEVKLRHNLAGLEDYQVEHVAASIIVNANESNYPLPEPVIAAVSEAVGSFPFNRYPPLQAETLAGVIAADLGLAANCVAIGNGSSELLERACYALGGPGKKLAFPYPSFSMYGEYAALSDSQPAPFSLTPEGYLDPERLIAFCQEQQPALLILCNPNNPTGNYNSLAVMEKIIAAVPCPVIADEAYMEFASSNEVDPQDHRPLEKLWQVAGSCLTILHKYSNLMIFRTFSKAYGLAGLRCGYAVGSVGLIRALSKALLPYHVNAFSLSVAQTVYQHKELYRSRVAQIKEERDKLAAGLAALGFKVWPTATNFVTLCPQGGQVRPLATLYGRRYDRLLAVNKPEAAAGKFLFRYLLEQGILVRDYSTHPALSGAIRITIGLPEENKQILHHLTTLCKEVLA